VVTLSNETPEYGEEIGSGIIIHYSKTKRPVEIEILNASKILASSFDAILQKARKTKP